MMIKINPLINSRALTTPEILRNLGLRFRDYRMRMKMTRKEISEQAGIGMTTLYKFETGNITDMSFRTLVRLIRAIDLSDNWEQLIPELPEDPYLYDDRDRKKQRVRHSTKKPSAK